MEKEKLLKEAPKLKIIHRGEDYIRVIFNNEEYEITGTMAIEVIEDSIKEIQRLKKFIREIE